MKYTLSAFRARSMKDILEEITSIPLSIDEVDFSKTGLFSIMKTSEEEKLTYSSHEIVQIINAIPNHIKHLNLSREQHVYSSVSFAYLCRLPLEEQTSIFEAIGNQRFEELTFTYEHLGVFNEESYKKLFESLKQKKLTFHACYLMVANNKFSNALQEAIRIPGTLTELKHLYIQENDFNNNVLKQVIDALSSLDLKEINVENNPITRAPQQEVIEVFEKLPTKCKVIGIDLHAMRNSTTFTTTEKTHRIEKVIEEVATLQLNRSASCLPQDATITDLITALVNQFTNTQSSLALGININFLGPFQVALVYARLCTLPEAVSKITNTSLAYDVHEFLFQFSENRKANISEIIHNSQKEFDSIIATLPASRQATASHIVSRILSLSKKSLEEAFTAYDNILRCYQTGGFVRSTSIVIEPKQSYQMSEDLLPQLLEKHPQFLAFLNLKHPTAEDCKNFEALYQDIVDPGKICDSLSTLVDEFAEYSDSGGFTLNALDICIISGKIEHFYIVLGENAFEVNDLVRTFTFAIQTKHLQEASYIFNSLNAVQQDHFFQIVVDDYECAPIVIAAQYGALDLLNLFLTNDHIKNDSYWNGDMNKLALEKAIINDHIDIVHRLIEDSYLSNYLYSINLKILVFPLSWPPAILSHKGRGI